MANFETNVEAQDHNIEISKMLQQRSREYLNKALSGDRGIPMDTETSIKMLYGPGKVAISLIPSVIPGVGGEAAAKIIDNEFDEFIRDPEGQIDKYKLGPAFIKNYVKSGAKNADEFFEEIMNGNIIF